MSTKIKPREIKYAMTNIRRALHRLDTSSQDQRIAWAVETLMDVLSALELISFADDAKQPIKTDSGWPYPDDEEDPEC